MNRVILISCLIGGCLLSIMSSAYAASKATTPNESIDDSYIPSPDSFVSIEVYPEPVYEENPEYPPQALESGSTGYVIVQAYVDKDGSVKKAIAAKTDRPGIGFEEAAVKAALKWKYKPGIQNGIPTGCWIAYTVKFVLSENLPPAGEKADSLAPPDSSMAQEVLRVPIHKENPEYPPPTDEFIPVDVYPESIYEEEPEYPRQAQENGFTGYVIIQAYVDRNGNVLNAMAKETKPLGKGFEEAAVEAAYKWKYKPAIQNGKPMGCWVSYRINFVLENR